MLVNKALVESEGKVKKSEWKAKDFAAFIGISGAYDLKMASNLLRNKGLGETMIKSLFTTTCEVYSPSHRIKEKKSEENNAGQFLPPFHLMHGLSVCFFIYLFLLDSFFLLFHVAYLSIFIFNVGQICITYMVGKI